ncbi:amino acid adenylation domain-containing protein, partial [Streptomyces sp. NPDC088846]|uniref:non-ribosomal peptide synthetase n=1 Tax=Streptomyces sp. NPDC088846 TaxID=3365908 RepID=UPI00381390B5
MDSDSMAVRFGYDGKKVDRGSVERLAGHFGVLLRAMLSDPGARVGELGVLTEAERRQLLVEWNRTDLVLPVDLAVHELFEARVRECPDAVALVFGDQSLSYAELNTRANQLAHHLKTLGVGAGALVGVCLDRGLDMVTALLGVLKAGGAYVPLDPAYPTDRLAFMLQDTTATAVITHEDLRVKLPAAADRPFVCLDRDTDTLAGLPTTNPVSDAGPDDLAYVIYTSGSTGTPKGVEVPRKALSNLLLGLQHKLPLTPQDRLLTVTTIMFDISNLELYLPLISGAQVVIASREQTRSPTELTRLLTDHHITVMQATPSVWRMLVDTLPKQTNTLHILTGGEALPPDLAHQLTHHAHRVTNLYGPTETTIWSTLTDIHTTTPTITIGTPLPNTQLFVMDPHDNPVPIGIPGELWIGGTGIARGYLNQPQLTAQRFTPHPTNPTAKIYRTGDLVRRLPDQTIEYLGRIDHQVKVRGHRIELGEIESALMTL